MEILQSEKVKNNSGTEKKKTSAEHLQRPVSDFWLLSEGF